MGNYSGIKQNVNTSIYENTNGDITGNVLNSMLQSIIDTLGTNANFMGMATPATVPAAAANVDGKQFYFATTAGTYNANFGSTVINSGDLYMFYCDTSGWHAVNLVSQLQTKIQSVETSIAQLAVSYASVLCVNMTTNNMAAYNNESDARAAIPVELRNRFMTLKYIYMDGAEPTIREEMYTENGALDIANDAVWTDNANWTTTNETAPINGFNN